jgi:membrane-bound metal-dependent hydrolase YbcI (DUF457 family)
MDNLTHTLVGVTLARTSLGRFGRGSTAALVLASNAPDADIVMTAGGALRYLQWHRGPSHGPLGLVGFGLVTAGLVWAGLRAFDGKRSAEHASYGRLAIISIVGLLVHVLMDLPTTYGTRLLSPFDWHWYSLDLIPIIDAYLLAVLLGGLALGLRSQTAARRSATIVLAFVLANYGVRAAAHERALALAPQVFGSIVSRRCDIANQAPRFVKRWPRATVDSPEPCVIDVAAMPSFTSPFHWLLVVQLSDSYASSNINILGSGLRAEPARTPNTWTPPVFTAARTEVGQVFLGFSRFPVAHVVDDPGGATTVRWTEMRFGNEVFQSETARSRRASFFSATVRLDPNGQVVEQHLGP